MSLQICQGLRALLFFVSVAACAKSLSPNAAGLVSQARPNFCTIPSSYALSNGTEDDSPAIQAAFAQCAQDSVIIFSEGVD